MKPPVGCKTIQQTAKELNIGANKLFELLREQHILDGNNRPYPLYIQRGTFQVKEGAWDHPDKGQQHYSRTYVTARGLTWLRKLVQRIRDHETRSIHTHAEHSSLR